MDELQKTSEEKDDFAQRCHDLDLQVSVMYAVYRVWQKLTVACGCALLRSGSVNKDMADAQIY